MPPKTSTVQNSVKKAKAKHVARQPINRPELDFILGRAAADASTAVDGARTRAEVNAWFNNLSALCVILYSTGLRLNEALKLTRDQLTQLLAGATINVFISKNQKVRCVRLSPAAVELWGATLPSTFLSTMPEHGLSNTRGQPLCKRTADRWLRPYFETLHARDVANASVRTVGCLYGTHSFRIGWVSRVADAIGINKASKIVGHSHISTTMRYLRTNEQEVLLDELHGKDLGF